MLPCYRASSLSLLDQRTERGSFFNLVGMLAVILTSRLGVGLGNGPGNPGQAQGQFNGTSGSGSGG